MCATSDANALIVNWSRFRGGKVPHFWPENAAVLGMKCYGRVCLHSSPRIFFSIFSYTSYTFWRKHQSVLEVFVCRMTWKILHPCRMNLHFEEKERQNEVKNAPASGRIPRVFPWPDRPRHAIFYQMTHQKVKYLTLRDGKSQERTCSMCRKYALTSPWMSHRFFRPPP